MNSQLKGRPRRGAAWSSAPAPSATPTVGDTSSPATVGRRVPLETNVADPHGRPRFDGDRCPLSRRGPACGPRPGYRSALARCSHGSSGGGRREIHPRGRAFDPGCSCDLLLGLAELIRQLTARLDRDPTGETNAPRRAASSVPQSWQPAPPLRLSHESIACSLIASISGARGPSTSHRRRPAAHLGRRRVRAYHQPRSQEPGPKVRRSTGSGSPSPLPERWAPRVPGAGTTPVVPPSAADAWGDARRDWSSPSASTTGGVGQGARSASTTGGVGQGARNAGPAGHPHGLPLKSIAGEQVDLSVHGAGLRDADESLHVPARSRCRLGRNCRASGSRRVDRAQPGPRPAGRARRRRVRQRQPPDLPPRCRGGGGDGLRGPGRPGFGDPWPTQRGTSTRHCLAAGGPQIAGPAGS